MNIKEDNGHFMQKEFGFMKKMKIYQQSLLLVVLTIVIDLI
jgi:hypothetical protein